MPLVTIRGQLGSGAPEIGKLIAEILHADYVDREVIGEVAARLHRQEQEVMEKETPPTSLIDRIAEALQRSLPFGEGFEGAYLPAWQIPLDDIRYYQTLESVIKDLARSPSIVILGRGSQFILKDWPRSLHVQVVAPLETRVKRVMEDRKIGIEAAEQEINRFASSTRDYIKRYFRAKLEDSTHYDLVINTGGLNYQDAASIALKALSCKHQT
jgi:cytidylate kinase